MLNLGKITGFYEKVLDGIVLRQKLINHNIANLSTPNYRAKRVDFEAVFGKALGAGSEMSRIRFDVHEDDAPANANGNNVNLESEWFLVEKNRIMHSIFTRALGGMFRALHTAMRGR